MENTIVTIFVILALIVGAVGGAVFTPNKTEIEIEYQDKIVEVPVNVTVEKLVEIPAPDMLSLAVDAFLIAIDDEEYDDDAATEDLKEALSHYDFDEMEINRIYNDYTISYEDDLTIVEFKVKLRFDEDDEISEKITTMVKVIFDEDEDEDTEVELFEVID